MVGLLNSSSFRRDVALWYAPYSLRWWSWLIGFFTDSGVHHDFPEVGWGFFHEKCSAFMTECYSFPILWALSCHSILFPVNFGLLKKIHAYLTFFDPLHYDIESIDIDWLKLQQWLVTSIIPELDHLFISVLFIILISSDHWSFLSVSTLAKVWRMDLPSHAPLTVEVPYLLSGGMMVEVGYTSNHFQFSKSFIQERYLSFIHAFVMITDSVVMIEYRPMINQDNNQNINLRMIEFRLFRANYHLF
jgi:hypothetical protein